MLSIGTLVPKLKHDNLIYLPVFTLSLKVSKSLRLLLLVLGDPVFLGYSNNKQLVTVTYIFSALIGTLSRFRGIAYVYNSLMARIIMGHSPHWALKLAF